MSHGLLDYSTYTGKDVSGIFMDRWRSKEQVGSSRPWCEVLVRRGRFERGWHGHWPDPQFGQILPDPIWYQWYADFVALDEWRTLDGIVSVDLDQSFDKNGITVATIEVDNVAWNEATGAAGRRYHQRDRGYLWPWRGYKPQFRPGSTVPKNEWYDYLPNAQILIRQGYGPDTAVKTFTGMIDSFSDKIRPDVMTLVSRDFGSVLADQNMFGWNKKPSLRDPVTFYPDIPESYEKPHRVIVGDATDVVACCLRWAGFKEWEIEPSGVQLNVPYSVDKSHKYVDVINAIKEQLGYVFFMAEPTEDNDLSIGVPIFRRSSALASGRNTANIALREKDLLTDIQPQHDNKDDRLIIRVRGVINNDIGRTLSGDTFKRVTFPYWPPWIANMSGVIKQLTYYNIGDKGSIGFKTIQECMVACVLIAFQIGIGRDTCTAQTAGQPALGLDSCAFLDADHQGVVSRLYITNRKTVMRRSSQGSSGDLVWATELGGSLIDNPEMDHIVNDFNIAVSGGQVQSTAPPGID